MPKQSITVDLASFSTDAKFRAWGLACSNAMAAAGLVKTGDTGQINWATVLKPASANQRAGYEIWRFNDALQATAPIFIKVEYGNGGSALFPGTSISVGTATNGAGTLQGLVLDPVASGYVTGVGNSANSAAPAQFAHSTGIGYALLNFGLAMLATAGSTTDWSHPGFYIIERTRDASGNPTAEGVGLTYGATSTASIFSDKAINFATGIVYGTARNPHCGAPATSYSVSTGDEVALFRHHIGMGKLVPAMARLGYYTTDIAAGTTFTAAAVGATPRTYFAWPPLVGSDSARSTSISLAYLWED